MSLAESMQKRAELFIQRYGAVREQLSRVIVGHQDIIHGILTCLFVGGQLLGRLGPSSVHSPENREDSNPLTEGATT